MLSPIHPIFSLILSPTHWNSTQQKCVFSVCKSTCVGEVFNAGSFLVRGSMVLDFFSQLWMLLGRRICKGIYFLSTNQRLC